MRIDRLIAENFKGFKHREFAFHPEFNLVVGVNGTGKTSVLDALSVALGGWFLGLRGYDSRPIRPHEVSLAYFEKAVALTAGREDVYSHWERQYPSAIQVAAEVFGEQVSWRRNLNAATGRTSNAGAKAIKGLASRAESAARSGGDVLLPLISHYRTDRLCGAPRDEVQVRDPAKLNGKENRSRLRGYLNSLDQRTSVSELVRWIARESWISFQERRSKPSALFASVSKAIVECIDDARDLYFDAETGEVIVEIERQGKQPFNNLSDGQRSMLALVGDIAQKAVTLTLIWATTRSKRLRAWF